MQKNKTFFQSTLLILIIGTLSACAPLQEKKPTPPSNLNVIELIIRGDYAQALTQAANNPDERQQVEKVIANYEAALPKKLEQQISDQRWEEANRLLLQAEHRIPDSPALKQAKARWKAIQEKEQQHLEIERLIANSEALYANMTIDRQLLHLDPENPDAKKRSLKYRKKTQSMVKKLLKTGQQALQEKNLVLAQQTLPLAYQLSATTESKKAKAALENVLTQQHQENIELRQQSLAQQRRQRLRALTSQLESALEKRELERAIVLLKQAEAINRNSEKIQPLQQQLHKAIEQVVEQHLEQGRKYYRQDQFSDAITSWSQVLKLSPDNKQAQINILRTEQVISNLKRLTEKDKK
ncbi:MAG: hypothetical protein L3J62_01750 [Gammaproteobacteria bacterium]|nr:hypothetical protein [Gammaproteobacteria bacterium]MCF6229511.1 hypothetical protein [Gammaproteobacteria bacterium]